MNTLSPSMNPKSAPVTMYRASDGKLFPTEREADAHSVYLYLCRTLPKFTTPEEGQKSQIYGAMMTLLTAYDLVKPGSYTLILRETP